MYLSKDKKGFTGTILTSTLSTIASTLEVNFSEFMGRLELHCVQMSYQISHTILNRKHLNGAR